MEPTSVKEEPTKTTVAKPEPWLEVTPDKPVVPSLDKGKEVEQEAPKQGVPSSILLSRAQREERLRKKAIELGEDPDKFITITAEDKSNSLTYRDRMETDARMCEFAIDSEEDPHDYMGMTVRERLIGEEVLRRKCEDKGIITHWLDTDEEWKKVIPILQENGLLW
jgi:hypothetical protein